MNKGLSIALLVAGIILVIWGINASNSLGSEMSEAVTGAPSDKTIWLIIGGIIAGLVGLFGLFRGQRHLTH